MRVFLTATNSDTNFVSYDSILTQTVRLHRFKGSVPTRLPSLQRSVTNTRSSSYPHSCPIWLQSRGFPQTSPLDTKICWDSSQHSGYTSGIAIGQEAQEKVWGGGGAHAEFPRPLQTCHPPSTLMYLQPGSSSHSIV